MSCLFSGLLWSLASEAFARARVATVAVHLPQREDLLHPSPAVAGSQFIVRPGRSAIPPRRNCRFTFGARQSVFSGAGHWPTAAARSERPTAMSKGSKGVATAHPTFPRRVCCNGKWASPGLRVADFCSRGAELHLASESGSSGPSWEKLRAIAGHRWRGFQQVGVIHDLSLQIGPQASPAGTWSRDSLPAFSPS